ncbi:hypothetical protein [Pseudorhodoplanes sp.]|jgi:hypothetical protein|uniref:hypothetical protein n=1 Tax=Pseudorhodoplanes sp. TaxID=1934341 RepID=UPI002D0CDC13|nr:hypothetical protein [Pseudorhodoplanes sp.]HWV43181.1 hypothetical protein [Pseudorhodoplanes sp.]
MAGLDDILPSAKDNLRKSTEMEAQKAAEYMKKRQAAEAEKKELLDKLLKPSGVSDEERMKRAAAIINRAVGNGLTEVEIARFSNKLFTDKGRAINQQEAGWEDTLTGLPKELHAFFKQYLEPRGYHIKFQIADWPDGMPGDVSMTLMWR